MVRLTSDVRIRAALPTLLSAMRQGARVMVLSHLGRPAEGKYDPELSLAPVAAKLSELLGVPVPPSKDWLGGIANTFLAAAGYKIGSSLCEKGMIAAARRLLDLAHARCAHIALPTDVIVVQECTAAPRPRDAG